MGTRRGASPLLSSKPHHGGASDGGGGGPHGTRGDPQVTRGGFSPISGPLQSPLRGGRSGASRLRGCVGGRVSSASPKALRTAPNVPPNALNTHPPANCGCRRPNHRNCKMYEVAQHERGSDGPKNPENSPGPVAPSCGRNGALPETYGSTRDLTLLG